MSVRLADGTAFPIPAKRPDLHDSPIWKARNAPATLTTDDLKRLADTSAAYSELILRSRSARVAMVSRAVRDAMRARARELAGLPDTG